MEILLYEEYAIQASIPESVNNSIAYGRSSDLLLPFRRPSRCYIVATDGVVIMELTAAGQLRIFTVFPFNPATLSMWPKPKALQMYCKSMNKHRA